MHKHIPTLVRLVMIGSKLLNLYAVVAIAMPMVSLLAHEVTLVITSALTSKFT